MKKLIIDTNFLMLPSDLGIDIFTGFQEVVPCPYQLYVLDKSIRELDILIANRRGAQKLSAKIAKQMITNYNLSIIKTEKNLNVDDMIVEIANADTIIATSDSELRTRLRKKGVPTIYLRQKRYLKYDPLGVE